MVDDDAPSAGPSPHVTLAQVQLCSSCSCCCCRWLELTAVQAASVFPPDGVPSIDAFARRFPSFKNILVLSGAGLSTAAGIPVRVAL
jgi:hypothetical protein